MAGGGKPSPQKVVRHRIREVERLLATGHRRAAIVAFAAEEWGVSSRTVDTYIQRAREQITEDWGHGRDEFLAELLSQLSTLQVEARESGAPHVALGCINAAARLTKLIGNGAAI